MADKISKEQRSQNMRAIKSISKLEGIVTRELWSRGVKFRKNVKDLKGKPDIAIKKYKVVVFIDSCFWHCCPLHGNMPKSNQEYWLKKLTRNKERDREITLHYIENRWHILRVWEHQIKQDFESTIQESINFINNAKTK
ncbi:very short patch repair endonuclease [Priestia megaterium]|uniref:very short patch repair endonuclease n=1 Tax=Priestia megaterium TaxID=1404 RepID=UPI00345A84D1